MTAPGRNRLRDAYCVTFFGDWEEPSGESRLKIIERASASEAHAQSIPDTGGVYLVPAFTGLGAPYWDPVARGAILGLTLDSGVSQIVRAALESVCYQTRNLMTAMADDQAIKPTALRVDGGMVRNDWLMQFLADVLDLPVERVVSQDVV